MTRQPSPYLSSSSWPSLTAYPTASSTPTISPFPTGTPVPTDSIQLDDYGLAPSLNEDSNSAPTTPSTVNSTDNNTMGKSRSGSTISPSPTLFDLPSLSQYPTASPTPTTSPFPTDTMRPTSTRMPSFTWYPTASPTPTVSPFPTERDLPSRYSSSNSLGYGHSCSDFEMGEVSINGGEDEVVFTYIAESTTSSIAFLNQMEIHLMDYAVSEALECAPEDKIHIYKIQYPNDGAASDAVPCKPSKAKSKSCWIMRTKMLITTESSDTMEARESVLSEMEAGLTEGKLVTDAFPDLTYTKYLGPYPKNNGTVITTSPFVDNAHVSVSNSNNTSLYFALGSIGLALSCAFMFGALYLHAVRRRWGTTKSMEISDDGSIEITELLSKSRQRIKEGAARQVAKSGSFSVVFDHEADIDTIDRNENQSNKDKINFHTKSSTKASHERVSDLNKYSSSAQHFYQNTSASLPGRSSSDYSVPSSVRSRDYEPSKHKYVKKSSSSPESTDSLRRDFPAGNLNAASAQYKMEHGAFNGSRSSVVIDSRSLGGQLGGTNLV